MYSIKWKDDARKQLKKLGQVVENKIYKWVDDNLVGKMNPTSIGHFKPLKGTLAQYGRYRVGDYRILVEINNNELTILIVAVGHRSDVYGGLERDTELDIAQLLIDNGAIETNRVPTNSSAYILPSGAVLDLGTSGYGHRQVAEIMCELGYDEAQAEAASPYLNRLGWIRINTQIRYIELSVVRPTVAQYESLKKAIETMPKDLQITAGSEYKIYSKDENTTEDIVERIKEFYMASRLMAQRNSRTAKREVASLEEDASSNEGLHVMQCIEDCRDALNEIIDLANKDSVTSEELLQFKLATETLKRRVTALESWAEELNTDDWVAEKEIENEDWE